MLFVDYTMTNIKNIRLIKIVSSVPEENLSSSQILIVSFVTQSKKDAYQGNVQALSLMPK